jgi:hypothetical protein
MKLWESARYGTAIRVVTAEGEVRYAAKPIVKVKKRKLTEAEDNAIGRAQRRRQNKMGWLPYAKR